jgi:hypothetical protein
MKRKKRGTAFVPELIFGTICATTVIPACGGAGSTTGNKDAGTGGLQGVAAGGFGGMSVAAGGFAGSSVAAGGFAGAMSVAAGGFAGMMSVAAGGFGGMSVAAGGFAGMMSVAAGGFGGMSGSDAGTDASSDASSDAQASLGNWRVVDAFSGEALPPKRRRAKAARGRRAKRRR